MAPSKRWGSQRAAQEQRPAPSPEVVPAEPTGKFCRDAGYSKGANLPGCQELGRRIPGLASAAAAAADLVISPQQLQPGFRVAALGGRQGTVEFVPSSGQEVLVQFGEDVEDLSTLEWVSCKDLRVVDSTRQQSTERADVRAYRDAVSAIKLVKQGLSLAEIAVQVGRPERWVQQKVALGDICKLPKPKGMEWWDSKGFCAVTYLRGYAREAGLYEDIVQGVEWEQDKVWRVRKQEGADDWHLRTVKECPGRPGRGFCGRSLQKVPDNTHQIGPQDSRHAAQTRPHGDWACELHAALVKQGTVDGSSSCCEKPGRKDPAVEPYWWCPKCQWYACNSCVKQMPDKATSKQVSHWRPGVCNKLDSLIADVVRDFHLPNPFQDRYTIKMNWYPDALSRVSPHRHDNWTLLVSLGAPRVLTVDRARVLMEDGDLVLFGTQSHGVPEMPSAAGGRLSLVFMFAPSDAVGAAMEARAHAGRASARRGGPAPAILPPAPCSIDASNMPIFVPAEQHEVGEDWDCEMVDAADGHADVDKESVLALCSMGFTMHHARSALASVDGDLEQATALLLAAAT